MPFPDTERVVYKKNPLINVICQLRYPPILKIDSEVPSKFQEAIREEYPFYNEKNELQPEFSSGPNPQSPQAVIPQLAKPSTAKNHEFCSADNVWKINLTRTFIAISTSEYLRWEDFIKRFMKPYNKLLETYNPPFFTRLGLRYVDVFNRSKLGLSAANWTELIQPYCLGLLSSPIANQVISAQSVSEIRLRDEKSAVRIATSLVLDSDTAEQCYMVDSDFYTPKKTNPFEVVDKLEFLHQRSSRLIQWIVTPALHEAMEPEKI